MPAARYGWLLLLALPVPAAACSLCGVTSKRDSLALEFDRADVVVYGRLANARLGGPRPGSGTTDLQVEKVVKAAQAWTPTPVVAIPQYLPILDPKDPPRTVAFFRLDKDGLALRAGRQITSPAILDYLRGLQAIDAKDVGQRLLFAAGYFDHADATVAEEAFLEFARADDREIAAVARKLSPTTLRKLVAQPNLEPEQLSMFAYLLGACGEDRDADLLRTLLKQQQSVKALEGVLAGYISLRPVDGWTLCHGLLGDPKEGFVVRLGAVRALRFFYNARPADTKAQVLHGMALIIPQGDLADFAANDLCTWKLWDHTALVLAQYGKPSHQAPIARRSLVRYALLCPLPEARAFVDRVRREDPELVQDVEEDLRPVGG